MLEDAVRLSYLISCANQLYQDSIQPHSFARDLDDKYKLSENLSKCKNMILRNLEQSFERFFMNHIQSNVQERNEEDLLTIKHYLQSFSYLGAKNIGKYLSINFNLYMMILVERLIEVKLMGPLLQNLENKVKEEKSTSIVATKQEYLKKGAQKVLPIRHFYNGIIEAVTKGKLSDFIYITENAATDSYLKSRQLYVGSFNLITNCVWKSVEKVLTGQQFAFLYSVGISDIFNSNFKAAVSFLNLLEAEIKNPEVFFLILIFSNFILISRTELNLEKVKAFVNFYQNGV